jgi:hypothetical protein
MIDAPKHTKSGRQPLYLVPAMVGVDRTGGPDEYLPPLKLVMLTVTYWAKFLRGPDHQCAFCHGDWDAWSDPTTGIGDYLAAYPFEETCPICQGHPA